MIKAWSLSEGTIIETWIVAVIGMLGAIGMGLQIWFEHQRSIQRSALSRKNGREVRASVMDGVFHHYARRVLFLMSLLWICQLSIVAADMRNTHDHTAYFIWDFTLTFNGALDICLALFLSFVLFKAMFVAAMVRMPPQAERVYLVSVLSVAILTPVVVVVRAVSNSEMPDALFACYVAFLCSVWAIAGGYSLYRVYLILNRMKETQYVSQYAADERPPLSLSSSATPDFSSNQSSKSSSSSRSAGSGGAATALRKTLRLWAALVVLLVLAIAETMNTFQEKVDGDITFYPPADSNAEESYTPQYQTWVFVLAYLSFCFYSWGPLGVEEEDQKNLSETSKKSHNTSTEMV